VVFKPSERAPQTSARLARHFATALPEGVVATVQGNGVVGALLAADPGVDVVVVHPGAAFAARR
jgi:acyl-CoA reductase-like NAD-dependent aldehyde dehydrogenase